MDGLATFLAQTRQLLRMTIVRSVELGRHGPDKARRSTNTPRRRVLYLRLEYSRIDRSILVSSKASGAKVVANPVPKCRLRLSLFPPTLRSAASALHLPLSTFVHGTWDDDFQMPAR